jgi:hypothetical protein
LSRSTCRGVCQGSATLRKLLVVTGDHVDHASVQFGAAFVQLLDIGFKRTLEQIPAFAEAGHLGGHHFVDVRSGISQLLQVGIKGIRKHLAAVGELFCLGRRHERDKLVDLFLARRYGFQIGLERALQGAACFRHAPHLLRNGIVDLAAHIRELPEIVVQRRCERHATFGKLSGLGGRQRCRAIRPGFPC